MADIGENDDTSAPAETPKPKRGRGRPPGLPKSGGRTKKSKDRGKLLDEAADAAVELLIDIIEGKEQRWSGPTGKSVLRRPTADEQLRASKEILSRREPVLQSVDSTFTDKTPQVDATDKRHAARAVLQLISEAHEEQAQDSVQSGHQEDATLLELRTNKMTHESGAMGEWELVKDTEGVGDRGVPIPSTNPEEGERVLIGEQGASIIYTKIDGTNRRKWAVVDSSGALHGFRKDQREAELLAANIGRPTQ